jgi:hypothetical protein
MISLSFVRNMSLSEETTPARVRRIKKQETRKTKLNDGDEATGGEEGVGVGLCGCDVAMTMTRRSKQGMT